MIIGAFVTEHRIRKSEIADLVGEGIAALVSDYELASVCEIEIVPGVYLLEIERWTIVNDSDEEE